MNKADVENSLFEKISTNSDSSENKDETISSKDEETFVSRCIHRPKPKNNINWVT